MAAKQRQNSDIYLWHLNRNLLENNILNFDFIGEKENINCPIISFFSYKLVQNQN
jgi:hypothetical protein